MSKDVKKAIDVSKECLGLGKFAFKNIANSLGAIAGVGGLVNALMAFIPDPDKPDPVLLELKELEKKIDELADKMSAHFLDMKAFITTINFYNEIITPTSKLTKYMMDCMNHPSKDAFNNFESEYKKQTVLSLAYTVLGLLEQKPTNPLKMAMDADPLKTIATFEKWDNIMNGVLGQFLFLEAFASGLIKDKSSFDSDRLIERSMKLFETIARWKEDYKNDSSYFTELDKYVEKYQDNNTNLSNSQKADELKKTLETILTNDSFYLIVYKKVKEWGRYGRNPTVTGQLIESDKGGCCVVIYRSRKANSVDIKQLEEMKEHVESYKQDKLDIQCQTMMFVRSPFYNAGFICLIRDMDEEIRSANCPRREWGPGWFIWARTYYDIFPGIRVQGPDTQLLVGFI